MSGHFATPLCVENFDDTANDGRGIWKVTAPLAYFSDVLGGSFVVEPGFLTDFASVPRVPFAYWLLGDCAHKAAVIHDYLFHHHEICDEQTANKVLLEAMEAEGIPAWRRWLIYAGVAVGGASSWEEDAAGDGTTVVAGRIV